MREVVLNAMKVVVPSSLSGAFYTTLSQVNFSNTITTGAILSTLVVAAIAGLFTIRSSIASTWKNNYEAEHTRCLDREKELDELRAKLLSEREEQQILRHELKNQVAALKLKTDLTDHEAKETTRHEEIAVTLEGIRHSMAQMASAMVLLATEVKNGQSQPR